MKPAIPVVAALLGGSLLSAQTPNVKLEDPSVIAKGNAIFSTTCGIGYCHGKEGRAGRGPRLAGKRWEKDYLFKVIANGVGNSLMPAFKDQFSTAELWSVVAYILTLSSGQGAPTAEAPLGPAGPPVAEPRSASRDPSAGDPEAGRTLFFDASNPKRCAGCHRFQGRGAEVGPDLTAGSARPPREILRDILEPDARLAVEPLTVVTKSGERVTGVKAGETRERVRIYDTRSLPPVLRTIYKDQIETMTPEKRSPMPGGYGRLFTRKQLLDLVAFLKGAPVEPGEVE